MGRRRDYSRLVFMGKQDTNVQKEKEFGLAQFTACMRRAGSEPASAQRGKLSRLLRKGIGKMLRVSQENCWSSQNKISYLQLNSAVLPRLIKPLTAVVGEAERDSKTFWFSLAASSRSPGNLLLSVTHSPSRKGRKGKGSGTILLLLDHLIVLPSIFRITFPHAALQILFTDYRQMGCLLIGRVSLCVCFVTSKKA